MSKTSSSNVVHTTPVVYAAVLCLQDNVMLEKACMAVEEAAKGGGVYPEVLFEVAHQWYWLYEQSVGGGSGQQREVPGRCGANGGPGRRPPETSCSVLDNGASMETQGMAAVTASVTATAVVPVISVGSTIFQSHTLPGQAIGHPHSQGLHPYTTIQAHLPTVCTPQYLGHTLQHVPRPAVFPVSGAAYPQVRHHLCTLSCSTVGPESHLMRARVHELTADLWLVCDVFLIHTCLNIHL